MARFARNFRKLARHFPFADKRIGKNSPKVELHENPWVNAARRWC